MRTAIIRSGWKSAAAMYRPESVPNGTVTLHILPDDGIFANQMLEPWAMLQPGVPYT